MSNPLSEKPNLEPLRRSGSAAVILDGRYLPPPEDKDGKIWARATVKIQAGPQDLYQLWRDVEKAPLWQEQIHCHPHRRKNISLDDESRRQDH